VRKAAEFGPVCPQIVPDLSREKEALRNVGRAVAFRGLAALQTGSERSFKPEDLNLAAKCPGNKGGNTLWTFGLFNLMLKKKWLRCRGRCPPSGENRLEVWGKIVDRK
jgi:hypothetical protein